MLKSSVNIEFLTWPGEGVVGFDGDNRAEQSKLNRSEIDVNEVGGGEADDEIGKKGWKTSKSKKLFKSKKIVGSSDFLTLGAKLAFIKLKQAFFKALILQHFVLKCYIRIETDISGYAISKVFS